MKCDVCKRDRPRQFIKLAGRKPQALCNTCAAPLYGPLVGKNEFHPAFEWRVPITYAE